MKRTLIIPLICMLFMQQLYAADFSRAIQATVGVPFVIDPAADCGIPRTQLCDMNGFYQPSPNSSSSYTPTLFTYTTQNYTGYGSTIGRVYTITPTATGVTSFMMTVIKISGVTQTFNSITYTFNIVDVTSISGLDDFSLSVGDTETMTPTITNQFAKATLTWKSSNKSVATVDADGKVTAVGAGTAKITCTAQNGISANCTVTVNPVSSILQGDMDGNGVLSVTDVVKLINLILQQ